jgi:hypothetical protein
MLLHAVRILKYNKTLWCRHESYQVPSAVVPTKHNIWHFLSEPKYHHGHNGELCTWGKSFVHQVFEIVAAKLSLLSLTKAAVTAVGAGFLTKLPLILLKLIALPVGLIILGLPLLLPILALFVPIPILTHNSYGADYGPSRQAEHTLSKALRHLLDSEGCIARLACELGRMNSESQYKKPVSW